MEFDVSLCYNMLVQETNGGENMLEIISVYYKKITAFLVSMLMLFATSLLGDIPRAKNPIVAEKTNYVFDTDRILIGGYGCNISQTDDEHMQYVVDAGIDFLVSAANKEFLDACARFGIGVIAKNFGGLPTYGWTYIDRTDQCPWLTFTLEDFVDHPALWGNDLMDEPAADSFPYLARMVDSYYSKTNGKIAYINLYPSYANEEQLGTKADWFAFSKDYQRISSYQKHVNAYIETVGTDYISVDIYPLKQRTDKATGKPYKYCEPTWLKNLDILAKACRDTNRDLWVITQVTGMPFEGDSVTRIADEADIRWQAYTALSFGAKAIIHACYQEGWWDESSHLITRDGQRNPVYFYVQAVNREIKALSDAYSDYKNIGAFVLNAYKESHTRIALSKVEFKAISDLQSEDTLLVGCFEAKEGDSKAFTMVNMNEISKNDRADAKFKLNGASSVTVYRAGVPSELTPDADGFYSLSLAPGEGVFVTVDY